MKVQRMRLVFVLNVLSHSAMCRILIVKIIYAGRVELAAESSYYSVRSGISGVLMQTLFTGMT